MPWVMLQGFSRSSDPLPDMEIVLVHERLIERVELHFVPTESKREEPLGFTHRDDAADFRVSTERTPFELFRCPLARPTRLDKRNRLA